MPVTLERLINEIESKNMASDLRLELTSAYAEVWLAMRFDQPTERALELEGLIEQIAKSEWGNDAHCEFDYDHNRITVKDGLRSRTFDTNEFHQRVAEG